MLKKIYQYEIINIEIMSILIIYTTSVLKIYA